MTNHPHHNKSEYSTSARRQVFGPSSPKLRWPRPLVLGLTVALLTVGPGPARAAETEMDAAKLAPTGEIEVSVENHAGALSASVPFAVPEYHGISPQLGLSYDSGSGDGFVGTGHSSQLICGSVRRFAACALAAGCIFDRS